MYPVYKLVAIWLKLNGNFSRSHFLVSGSMVVRFLFLGGGGVSLEKRFYPIHRYSNHGDSLLTFSKRCHNVMLLRVLIEFPP